MHYYERQGDFPGNRHFSDYGRILLVGCAIYEDQLGTVTYEISTIFDGGFLVAMGIAIVISCLREWDSEKGKKSVKKK